MDGDVTLEDIYRAYYDCRKNKRGTYSALEFEVNYEEELSKLLQEINNRTYKIGKSICFIVTKPKLREVFAADFRDRIVHHLVIRKLEGLFEEYFINDTYNCRKDKGVLYGLGRLQEKLFKASEGYTRDVWIAKFDCKGFFMNIHKPTLWKMLEKFITERYNGKDKETILWLTKCIVLHRPQNNCSRRTPAYMWERLSKDKSLFTCNQDCGLPIGNLSSQAFANFYLSEFDRYMSSHFNGMYGRYVDDFFIIGDKNDILAEIGDIKKMLADLHITLHPNKMYLQHYSKGVRFTGGIIKFGRRYLNNKTISNFRKSIDRLNAVEDKEHNITAFTQSINSYLGLLGKFREYKVRKREMLRIEPAWYKYMYIEGSYKKIVIKKKYKERLNILNQISMIRVTDYADKFCAVRKFNEKRYRINFDKVPVVIEDKESGTNEETNLATWTQNDYYKHPTTEQVQADVIKYTIQRYVDEGLEPPKEEDIDVSAYVID